MSLYALTTKFPAGQLESKDLLDKAGAAREAYRKAAPSFHILSSHKVGSDTLIDIAEADSGDEARAAASAIAEATGTEISIDEAMPYNKHLATLEKGG